WDYTSTERTNRLAQVEKRNFTVYFENDQVVRWEGDYFQDQDEQLAKAAPKQFGRNLAKDKKNQRGR
ncbi:outer membrane protein assembly factor BamE, partial [Paraburkholderia sp. SIMBA_053]|uniref:outer membrane protein assembly factor BamE domain-containing protein n=1 Tax=Paraburkholderia sp. SIMBA_053 TaxID=3085794 RepID=UPI0039797C30